VLLQCCRVVAASADVQVMQLIDIVQRPRRESKIGAEGSKGVAVRAGTDRICSQSSCTGGRGEGR
jgi:hypothetical protein